MGNFSKQLWGDSPERHQLTAAEMTWGLRGQRVRFLPLLQTALQQQVLRQVGSVYQFRHAALQDLLTRLPLPEVASHRSRTPQEVPDLVVSGRPDDVDQTRSSDSPED